MSEQGNNGSTLLSEPEQDPQDVRTRLFMAQARMEKLSGRALTPSEVAEIENGASPVDIAIRAGYERGGPITQELRVVEDLRRTEVIPRIVEKPIDVKRHRRRLMPPLPSLFSRKAASTKF